jgi:hypothetical protein
MEAGRWASARPRRALVGKTGSTSRDAMDLPPPALRASLSGEHPPPDVQEWPSARGEPDNDGTVLFRGPGQCEAHDCLVVVQEET